MTIFDHAHLVLSDGASFEGTSFGAPGWVSGEVVFNTSMTGYQEVLTDPSYAGQIVVMTYPLVGNYGINEHDFESRAVQVRGFVVREACETPSHWQSTTPKSRSWYSSSGMATICVTVFIFPM